jgi:spermidine synthase
MTPPYNSAVATETIDRRTTPRGELALRRDGERYEIISNGVFLMDTSDGRSERLLVRAALDATPAARLLIGGLGVGFSLAEAVAEPRLREITVVEREPAVVEWQAEHLGRFSGYAVRDPRVRIVVADLVRWLRSTADRYDAVCLDIDNGPEWTVTDDNAALYTVDGIAAARGVLAPGGVLAVWSAAAAPPYEARLRNAFGRVETLPVTVGRGEPDVVYVASSPSPQ